MRCILEVYCPYAFPRPRSSPLRPSAFRILLPLSPDVGPPCDSAWPLPYEECEAGKVLRVDAFNTGLVPGGLKLV